MLILLQPTTSNSRSFYENHTTYHAGDCGVDLFCPQDLIIPGGALGFTIDLQVKCMGLALNKQLSENELHTDSLVLGLRGYFLAARSSISNTPLILANSVGVIDAQYFGNLMAKVHNLSDEDYVVKAGTRLFQVVDPQMRGMHFQLVDELPQQVVNASTRGTGGFGSTGGVVSN